jgi:hypothetical protein
MTYLPRFGGDFLPCFLAAFGALALPFLQRSSCAGLTRASIFFATKLQKRKGPDERGRSRKEENAHDRRA